MAECCHHKLKARTAEEKQKLNSRLNRIIGQLGGVKKMIEQDCYCDDVLIQLAAIDKAVKSLAAVVLEAHMHSCLIENIQSGNVAVVDEIVDLFKRFQ
ncbi:MAG: metal-sensing transcriptional repressor [Clostridia bacterium]|nr:metal-sensing transcriptional repressor [Clostridia bacterium]